MKVHKLPGYTGFQPFKEDTVGMTTGAANRFSEGTFKGKKMTIDTANFMLNGSGSQGSHVTPKSPTAI